MDTREITESFNDAFNRHDVDAVMAAMTHDCVFVSTGPGPAGDRHDGQTAVRRAFEQFFEVSPNARFTIEDMFVAADRAAVQWRYDWDDGHIHGVDIFTVRNGKVAEKHAYVKG